MNVDDMRHLEEGRPWDNGAAGARTDQDVNPLVEQEIRDDHSLVGVEPIVLNTQHELPPGRAALGIPILDDELRPLQRFLAELR
jgi:hypothetical protein